MTQRRFIGTVVAAKTAKTVIVEVVRQTTHPRYGKRLRVRRRWPAHDERGEYRVGDRVEILETRPLSKTKRWRVVGKVQERAV